MEAALQGIRSLDRRIAAIAGKRSFIKCPERIRRSSPFLSDPLLQDLCIGIDEQRLEVAHQLLIQDFLNLLRGHDLAMHDAIVQRISRQDKILVEIQNLVQRLVAFV